MRKTAICALMCFHYLLRIASVHR